MRIMTPSEAVALIPSGAFVVPGGFGSCGHPDLFTIALERLFLDTGQPRNLNLLFASGAGNKKGMGLDKLAHRGLVKSAIGGFWGLCPHLRALGEAGDIEAHNWPQGVISKLFGAIASGAPGVYSPVGLHTFVDPRMEGGVFRPGETQPKVSIETFRQNEYLFYPAVPVDIALLRGTTADPQGNISLRGEASKMDALSQAQAARNSGGKVMVQVASLSQTPLHHNEVDIPAHLVDIVVASASGNHPFTYGENVRPSQLSKKSQTHDPARDRIIRRALCELPIGKFRKKLINFGIGIPSQVGGAMSPEQRASYTVSIESGVIGGTPLSGDSFGASIDPEALLDQSELFTFYDGGGVDKAFLGFAEIDSAGQINVSKFGRHRPGAGGFINIASSAKELIFCGHFMVGGHSPSEADPVSNCKFVDKVEQITFNPRTSQAKRIVIITDVGVFEMDSCSGQMTLTEVFGGMSPAQLAQYSPINFCVSRRLTEALA